MEKDEILDYVTNTPENTNRAVLGDMLDNYSGGGSNLPDPSTANEGNVLTVNSGEWTAENPYFIVTLTPVDSDYSGFMDKNGAEIRSAYEAGKRIIFNIPTMNATVELQTTSLYDQDGIDTLDAGASFWYNVLGQDYLMTIHTYGDDFEAPTYDVQWFVLTPATNE